VQPASVDLKVDAGPALIEEHPPQLRVSLETFHSQRVKRRYRSAPPLDGEVKLLKGQVPLVLGRTKLSYAPLKQVNSCLVSGVHQLRRDTVRVPPHRSLGATELARDIEMREPLSAQGDHPIDHSLVYRAHC